MIRQDQTQKKSTTSLNKSLKIKLYLSKLILTFERLMQAFWPPLVTALLILSLLIWQVHTLLTFPFDIGLYSVLTFIFIVFSVRGVLRFSRVTQRQVIMRLDETRAVNNPLTTLMDRQFIGTDDEDAQELWHLHRKRMAEDAEKTEVRPPHIRLSQNDPWALRLISILFFSTAFFFGQSQSDQSLIETVQDVMTGTTETSASFEIWAEPPAYTGFPSIYLNTVEKDTVLELPQGTALILRNYGASALKIISTVAELEEDQTKFAQDSTFEITQSGSLALKKGLRTLGRWEIEMIPDKPPFVELTGDISRTLQGSVQIPYAAADDYGITGGTVEITLDLNQINRTYGLALPPEQTDPIQFDLALPFNADTTDFEETVIEDLAEHPWAGLPVKITLSVTDAAGNTASTEPIFTPMPGKRFFDTLAAAISEQRRDLLWNRKNINRVTRILKALTYRPEEGFPNQHAYLMVRSVIRRIGYIQNRPIDSTVRDDIAETLWRAALLIEDGDLSDAAARLKRAQDRLSEAMKNGATEEEIAELMEELREATREYLRELAENAQPQDQQQADNQNTQEISPDTLQDMMDRIQELMEQGRMEEAQALLNQLQQMLENMQVTQGQPQEGGEGQQGMEGLQDTLRQQQDLADETFRQLQDEFNQGQDGQQPQQNQQGSNNGQQGEQDGLVERQQALRDLLNEQLRGLNGDNSEAGQRAREALENAEREMGQAADNLERQRNDEALDNQANAVEALRRGMQELSEAARQANQGQAREGQQNSESDGPDIEDPLGRSQRNGRAISRNGPLSHSDKDWKRSQEILEEIQRRSGERFRPEYELEYLDRLLDRF